MKKILALDPGGTTGWARATLMDDGTFSWLQGYLGPQEHHKELYILLEMEETCRDFTIVCEGFDYRNDSRPGLELVSREYIGIAKLFAKQRLSRPVVLQPPSSGKIRGTKTEGTAFVKKRNLQALDLWNLGPNSAHHMVDATGHLLYYMLMTKNVLPKQVHHDLLVNGGWR